jgi:hypothetical protein
LSHDDGGGCRHDGSCGDDGDDADAVAAVVVAAAAAAAAGAARTRRCRRLATHSGREQPSPPLMTRSVRPYRQRLLTP